MMTELLALGLLELVKWMLCCVLAFSVVATFTAMVYFTFVMLPEIWKAIISKFRS